jgi:hypothetical protein
VKVQGHEGEAGRRKKVLVSTSKRPHQPSRVLEILISPPTSPLCFSTPTLTLIVLGSSGFAEARRQHREVGGEIRDGGAIRFWEIWDTVRRCLFLWHTKILCLF